MYSFKNDVKHNNFISIAKAIGIISVVMWHSRPPFYLGIFLMLFAVPLFFFTSGYFFKPSNNIDDYGRFCKKRVKSLYFPFVKWSLIFMIFHNLFYKLNIYNNTYGYNGQISSLYSFDDYFNKFKNIIFTMSGFEQLLGAFWFIKTLFLASLFIASVFYIY